MNTSDLKIDLIEKITKLEDVSILKAIKQLLDFELDEGVFHLSEAQKERIAEARNDKTLTEDEANGLVLIEKIEKGIQQSKKEAVISESDLEKEIEQWFE